MKKYVFLTSILALAACGGGGHHHHDYSMPAIPAENAIRASDVASNGTLTAMASEIGVDANGNQIILARGATGTVVRDGVEYTAYRLDDVDFEVLSTPGDTQDLRFTVDKNGRIDGIRFENAPKMVRTGDTDKFTGNGAEAQYISYSKDLGLKYADFGTVHITPAQAGQAAYDRIFAGGYDIKEIDDDNIASDAVFTGTAKGVVTNGTTGTSAQLEDKNASLAFNKATGNETLNASFDNWYDMNVTKTKAGITATFDEAGKTIANDVKFAQAPSANLPEGVTNSFNNLSEAVVFDTDYYGDHNVPSEATALVQYQQIAGSNPNNLQNVNVSMGFGGKR